MKCVGRMKKNILGLLAFSLAFTGFISFAQPALALLGGLEFPEPVQPPTSNVYVCENAEGGGVVVSIKEMKFFMTDRELGAEQALPVAMSDLVAGRCAHTYRFNLDLFGQTVLGAISGCSSGAITLTLSSPTDSEATELSCVFKP